MVTKIKFILYVIVLSFIGASYQALGHRDISELGEFEIKLQVSTNLSVKCFIKVIKYSADMSHNRCWGSDWSDPRTVIGELKIWINNKEIIVPLSSYADLSNINWASLKDVHEGYRLHIKGGDAASSYDATIDFDEIGLFGREVHNGEEPKVDWEKTIYSRDTTSIY